MEEYRYKRLKRREQAPALRQKSNVHLYNRNKQITVGGDVPDAPFKTITANLTFAR